MVNGLLGDDFVDLENHFAYGCSQREAQQAV